MITFISAFGNARIQDQLYLKSLSTLCCPHLFQVPFFVAADLKAFPGTDTKTLGRYLLQDAFSILSFCCTQTSRIALCVCVCYFTWSNFHAFTTGLSSRDGIKQQQQMAHLVVDGTKQFVPSHQVSAGVASPPPNPLCVCGLHHKRPEEKLLCC